MTRPPAAEDEFQDLCFQYGIELDDVVRMVATALAWHPTSRAGHTHAGSELLPVHALLRLCIVVPNSG